MTQKAEKANKVKVWSDANKETMTQKVKKENRVISRRVCSKETTPFLMVPGPFGEIIAQELYDLDKHHQDEHRCQHHWHIHPFIAVGQGHIPNPAGTDDTGLGRSGDQADGTDGGGKDHGTFGFRQDEVADNLEIIGTHGLGSPDDPFVHTQKRIFIETGQAGDDEYHQRDQSRFHPDPRPHDEFGEGKDEGHQDDEGKAAEKTDHGIEQGIHHFIFQKASFVGQD